MTELFDSPAAEQARWAIAVMTGERPLDLMDIKQRFTDEFLGEISAAAIVEETGSMGLNGARIERIEHESPFVVGALLSAKGMRYSLRLEVTSDPPHRIELLRVEQMPAAAVAWQAVEHADAAWCESSLSASVAGAIADVRETAAVPGMVAGVVRDGASHHRQGLGVGDIGAPATLGADSIFRTGSVTKIVTSLVLCRLVARGALALDDPIAEHLTSVEVEPNDASDSAITVRHVLTHTAGFPRHQRELDGAGTFAESVSGRVRAIAPPGAKAVYSNLGFGLLGELIADVARRPYADVARDEVFEPLGMKRSSISPGGVGREVRGHTGALRMVWPCEEVNLADEGAGALCSTIDDLATLAVAAMDGNEHLSLVDEAMRPQGARIPAAGERGLGFARTVLDGRKVVWHNGGLRGWKAAWYLVPEERLAVVLLANRNGAPLDELARDLLRALA